MTTGNSYGGSAVAKLIGAVARLAAQVVTPMELADPRREISAE